ncbi:hypothetical protein AH332_09565 [Salmonella enterica subsp. salamae]|nr:hypothetical protein [Salmonella enterica subsp. salamae]EDW4023206.1 hypothetical protein [Salmonella enterica subsp. salamae]
MQKAEREAAIAANKKPATPEQRLVIYADLEGVLNIAEENTRHNEKAKAMEYIWNWLRSGKKQALNEIKQREKGE